MLFKRYKDNPIISPDPTKDYEKRNLELFFGEFRDLKPR